MSQINRIKQMLATGRIDRRGFMQGAMALGVTISAASLIAADVEAMNPKKGGYLKIGKRHGSTTDSLDPGTAENGFMTQTGYCYGNHLTEVNSNGDLVPELCEGYSSEDAVTWRFDMRQGVEFHNGKTLTADDVIASLQHHMGDDSKSAAKGLLSTIKSMSADGNTVVIELTGPDAGFPFIMSDYHLIIMPSVDGKVDA
ncbi:MAG: ABC transporter substrate-binding protein, partial [Alphaproteobacteria bacterium]